MRGALLVRGLEGGRIVTLRVPGWVVSNQVKGKGKEGFEYWIGVGGLVRVSAYSDDNRGGCKLAGSVVDLVIVASLSLECWRGRFVQFVQRG